MELIIPVAIILIILPALFKNVPVYSTFCDGVKDGMMTVFNIFPVICAITVCVYMMRESGFMELLLNVISPVTDFLKIPREIMPLALIRPISGGGAIGVLGDILKEYSPDSKIGFIASVIMGSTETTFYTLMVYFKNTRVKYNGYIIPAAIFGDIVAVLAGVWMGSIFF